MHYMSWNWREKNQQGGPFIVVQNALLSFQVASGMHKITLVKRFEFRHTKAIIVQVVSIIVHSQSEISAPKTNETKDNLITHTHTHTHTLK